MAPSSGHHSNPSSATTGDRQHHAANGRPPGLAARHSGTPRKGSGGRDKAVQDPGLKDYRLGECLGKGAFGAVYKAIHWGTGEAVAVKQIKLVNLPKSELRMIEAEIDLLKNLHHDNIVKYVGFVKSVDCLNIVLEYCENGSLHSICKAYGKFPENLVGVYMTQVLQGLQYLHDQGVIHRDIKGANILTTKDGKVKLADFGVSTSTLSGPDKEAQVVGTPYWMAPEIIELSGATPASDIWSLGCTVIELLQGNHRIIICKLCPHCSLLSMTTILPPLKAYLLDFLMQCFQKDPNLRVSARKLLKHNWIVGCRRSDAPVAKASANFSQAVEEVKQWNKALTSDNNNLRASTGSDSGPLQQNHPRSGLNTPAKGPLTLAKPRPTAEDFRSPELADDDNWDNDFATAISPTALQLPLIKPQDHFGGMLSADRLKQFASIDNSRDISGNWDTDMDGELMTMKNFGGFHEEDPQEKTIRPNWRFPFGPEKSPEPKGQLRVPEPTRSPRKRSTSGHYRRKSQQKSLENKFELPSRPDILYREQTVEDYSDLFDNNDQSDLIFNQRLGQSRKPDTPQLFHPSDLTSLPRSTQSPVGGSMRRTASSRPSVLPDRQFQRSRSSIEIQKFAESEGDEDFSDIFGPGDNITEKDESDRGSEDGGLMVISKLSNNSWLGDDEDEDDPFAFMDPGWDEMDLEANIARDRHARLAEKVEELVRSIKMIEGEEKLSELSEDLLALLWEHAEVKDLIISAHGLLPILELLEPCTVKSRQHMILQLLKVVNTIILDDVELQENICFVGGIPIITKFAARQYSNEIRLEAAAFVRQMYQTSTLTLQMFVSAGGLNVLVEFLDEDYDSARDLVLIGVNGIWNVFELQGPTPKNDFCRIFSRSKILDPLALVLHRVLDEDEGDELIEAIEGRIVNIFYLFSQAENYVKEMVADRQVLKSILKDLHRMTPAHQITMLKFIKNLSMLSTTLETLHSADAIDLLIDLLGGTMKKSHRHFREISNQVLNTLFNLCRLSKDRQEYAAVNGIVPLLLKIMKTDRPPKEFVLPILCDMAHSGSKGRRFLWQNKGLDFYVSLLADQYWQVTALDAIFVWLQEETAKVEGHLINGNFTNEIISCFTSNKVNAFDPNLLEPLLKLIRLSPSLSSMLATSEMFSGIGQKLGHKKAVVRLNLLRLVRNILDARETDYFNTGGQRLGSVDRYKQRIEPVCIIVCRGKRRSRAAQLTAWLAPDLHAPSLHSSASTPMTPTHAHRSSQSSAYIEVAQSPKRSAVSITHERDPSIYRPRSRDSTGIPMSSIPRRVSGDLSSSVGSSKSRLPRNNTNPRAFYHALRVFSNKENNQASNAGDSFGSGSGSGGGGSRYPFMPESPTMSSSSASSRRNGSVSSASTSHSRSGSGKQRRSRAPSEGGAKKWTPGA
ncbi:uncharacterized protein PG998_000480 [Apiospora kogelbergensis]|uniref:uncharacterized protein n=1 Tax=Apiospora kogelbergensis TaxID=1337665 RepID=UPI0031325522